MYRLFIFIALFPFSYILSAQVIDIYINDERACFVEGTDSVLCYQIAEKSFEGRYKRSNYIHPLYTLDGKVLTEDFPADHLHHRGIFWTWHQLYVGEKRIGDPWEIKDFCWDVKKVKKLKKENGAVAIVSEILWKSPLWQDIQGSEKPVVQETTTITAFPREGKYREIDIEISLLALEKNMRIGGSEDPKGYGGFSPRIRLVEDSEFTNAIGLVEPTNLPVAASPWMDISGSVGKNNAKVGMTILSHPENPGYPNPWILRKKKSMQNAVFPHPGAEAVPLSDETPTVLRYRLIIHEGDNKTIDIAKLNANYGKG